MKNDIEIKRCEATRRFNARYAIRRELEKIDGSEESVRDNFDEKEMSRRNCADLVRPFDPVVNVGDIRLLADAVRLTYVMVLQDWGEEFLLAMPFSSYADPAFDGEMTACKSGGVGLAVFQLWNTRPLPASILSRSWKVESADAELLEDALSSWRGYIGLLTLSENQWSRTGVPIESDSDPRREYLESEKKNLKHLLEEHSKADHGEVAKMSVEEWQEMVSRRIARRRLAPIWRHGINREESQYALAAAEKKAPEFLRAECRVEGTDCLVRVAYDKSQFRLSLQVFDGAGNESASLNGWKLADGNGTILGEIRESSVTVSVAEDFDGVCCLVDPQGEVHALIDCAGDR